MEKFLRWVSFIFIFFIFISCGDEYENKSPIVEIFATPSTVTQGDSIFFDGSASRDNGSISSYVWKENSNILSKSMTFTEDNLSVGEHNITLTVTDNNNLSSSKSIIVTVEEKTIATAILGNLADATVTISKVEDYGAVTKLWTETTSDAEILDDIGKFYSHRKKLDDDSYYIFEVSGGKDWDSDDDGIKDKSYVLNKGTIRAIAKGKDIKQAGDNFKVTAISELIYQEVANRLINFDKVSFERALQDSVERIFVSSSANILKSITYDPKKDKTELKSIVKKHYSKIVSYIHIAHDIDIIPSPSLPNIDNAPDINTSTPTISGDCTNGNIITANVDGVDIEPSVTCSGNRYFITPSLPLSEGIHKIKVKSSFEDTVSDYSESITISIDTTPPILSIIDDEPEDITMSESDITFTFIFYKDVRGFSIDDIEVSGGTKKVFTAINAHTYTLSITPDANSVTPIDVVVPQAVARDIFGNGNLSSSAIQKINTLQSTLKKTGQTKSYDSNGYEVTNKRLKDDGYYQKGKKRDYTRDNTKDVVIDNITNLMWQDDTEASSITKSWLAQINYDKCTGENNQAKDESKCSDTSGDTAYTYCENLTLGGYTDWRLPTYKELKSLVYYGKSSSSIDRVFINTFSDAYWTFSTEANHTNYAWGIDFDRGNDVLKYKSNLNHIRCVRDIE